MPAKIITNKVTSVKKQNNKIIIEMMIIKMKKEIVIIINSNLTVVLSVYAKPGGTPHMKGLGMILVVSFRGVSWGCKFRILVSLRVFWAKRHHI